MTPSELLTAAADRVRDLAAAAMPGPWTAVLTDHIREHIDDPEPTLALGAYVAGPENRKTGEGCSYCMRGNISPGTAEWIAALSPAIAAPLEAILRDTAGYFEQFAHYWVTVPEHARNALDLARSILGSGVDTP